MRPGHCHPNHESGADEYAPARNEICDSERTTRKREIIPIGRVGLSDICPTQGNGGAACHNQSLRSAKCTIEQMFNESRLPLDQHFGQLVSM
jgi:hypothetical protein